MPAETSLQHRFYDLLMESQWWSAEQLRDYQRGQLGQLLRHARKNVPFYEHRLDAVLKPNGDIDWDRWTEIPIVTRRDMVEHRDAMQARELPRGHWVIARQETSGTSGPSVEIVSTQVSQIAFRANRFRADKWHGIDCSRVACSVFGEDVDTVWPDGKNLGPWGPPWDTNSSDGRLIRINYHTPVPKLLEFFRRKEVAYLLTGPKGALALALEMEAMGETYHLDAFLPHGAAVEDYDREVIARALGARSVDLYSSKEGAHMAHACPDFPGLHVNSESLLLEIVDDQNRPLPAGRPGRVIITPFYSTAQPLIRYDQGDIAIVASVCPCGRCLPRLSRVVGRGNSVFFHPDGRVRQAFISHHAHLLHCAGWQVAQVAPTVFEVRYVPGHLPPEQAEFTSRLREAYFDDAEVHYVRIDEVPVSQFGKPVQYANEWRPMNGGGLQDA